MVEPLKSNSHSLLRAAPATNSLKRSEGIVSVEGCVITVADFAAREGTSGTKTINLNDFLLPPTAIYRYPTSLGSRGDLVDGIATAALGLGRRTSATSKSGPIRVANAIQTFSKFVEYGWLNGLYSWKDWTPAATRKLLETLGSGGWAAALNLVDRSEHFFRIRSDVELSRFIQPTKAKSGGYSLKNRFREELGTNLRQTELIPAKMIVLKRLGIARESVVAQQQTERVRPKLRSYEAGMGETHLRQDLSAINLLAECGDDPPLEFVPFPDTVKLAKQYGRSGGRTGNLTPDIVADLLKDAFWWMEEVADPLLSACEHIMSEVDRRMRADQTVDPRYVFRALRAAPEFENIEQIIGIQITSVGLSWEASDDDISLKQLVYSLATACFVTIAFLNARRKDEISHKKIGLHRRALRVISRELRLYECEFFIQKSTKAYVPFYVGEITRTAIRVLERLSDIARALQRILHSNDFSPEDAREDKLFQLPQFASKHDGGGSQWYIFRTGGQGHSDFFVWRALQGKSIHIHPHMFRRAHALIHHYRFEHSTLQQLCQQLVHTDLATTVGYVRDVGVSETGTPATAYASSALRGAQAAAIDEVKREIADVARERVRELVSQVINDGPRSSGGFALLIRRFHQRLGSRIEYQLLSGSAQSEIISESLINHGHAFRPMRQANCVASPTRRNRSARCYSKESGSLSKENASAITCTNCPYSHWVEGHHAALKEDILALEEELTKDKESVKGRARVIELANLKRVLDLRRKRLEGEKGQ